MQYEIDDYPSPAENAEKGPLAGRWSTEEHAVFVEGLRLHGRDWKKIGRMIPTRTVTQIRTHAQKHFVKMTKAGNEVPGHLSRSHEDTTSPTLSAMSMHDDGSMGPIVTTARAAAPGHGQLFDHSGGESASGMPSPSGRGGVSMAAASALDSSGSSSGLLRLKIRRGSHSRSYTSLSEDIAEADHDHNRSRSKTMGHGGGGWGEPVPDSLGMQGLDLSGSHYSVEPGSGGGSAFEWSPRAGGGERGSPRASSGKRAAGAAKRGSATAAPPRSPLCKPLRGGGGPAPAGLADYGGIMPLPVQGGDSRQPFRSKSFGSIALHSQLPAPLGREMSRSTSGYALEMGSAATSESSGSALRPPWPVQLPPPPLPAREQQLSVFGAAGLGLAPALPSSTGSCSLAGGGAASVTATGMPAAAAGSETEAAPHMAAVVAVFGPPSPTFNFALADAQLMSGGPHSTSGGGRQGSSLVRQNSAHARLNTLAEGRESPVGCGTIPPAGRARLSRGSTGMPRSSSHDSLAALAIKTNFQMQLLQQQQQLQHQEPGQRQPLQQHDVRAPRALSPLALAAAQSSFGHAGAGHGPGSSLQAGGFGDGSGSHRTSIEMLGLDRLPVSLGGTRTHGLRHATRPSGSGNAVGGLCSELPFFLEDHHNAAPAPAAPALPAVSSLHFAARRPLASAAAQAVPGGLSHNDFVFGTSSLGGSGAAGLHALDASRVASPMGLVDTSGSLLRGSVGPGFGALQASSGALLTEHHQRQQQQQRAMFNAGAGGSGALTWGNNTPAGTHTTEGIERAPSTHPVQHPPASPPPFASALPPSDALLTESDEDIRQAMELFLRPLSPQQQSRAHGSAKGLTTASVPFEVGGLPLDFRAEFSHAAMLPVIDVPSALDRNPSLNSSAVFSSAQGQLPASSGHVVDDRGQATAVEPSHDMRWSTNPDAPVQMHDGPRVSLAHSATVAARTSPTMSMVSLSPVAAFAAAPLATPWAPSDASSASVLEPGVGLAPDYMQPWPSSAPLAMDTGNDDMANSTAPLVPHATRPEPVGAPAPAAERSTAACAMRLSDMTTAAERSYASDSSASSSLSGDVVIATVLADT